MVQEHPPRPGIILVVEDRDDVRLGMAELLELSGFSVADAADAEQALAYLTDEGTSTALILLDLMLPGHMSGIDLRARQLADSHLASIPTVVISACDPGEVMRGLLSPDAWLNKPFRFDHLMDLVRRFVLPDRHSPAA
jgi:CheY-like chemotaxis protein